MLASSLLILLGTSVSWQVLEASKPFLEKFSLFPRLKN